MLDQVPLNQIVCGCQQKKPGYCFELFRRVFDERDQEAANELYEQYKRLVFNWVYKNLKGYRLPEQDVEDIASQATMKFFDQMMRSVPLASRYEDMAQLLGYWRTCVRSTVIDFQRKKMRQERLIERWSDKILTDVFLRASAEEKIQREEFSLRVRELLNQHLTKQEKRYLELKIVEGLKRREIAERFPEQFPLKIQDKIWDRIRKRLRKLFKIYLRDYH
jgi:RNA polymerase sigma factor (sigma-70 family)